MKRSRTGLYLLAALSLAACSSQALTPTTSRQVLTGKHLEQLDTDFVTYAYQVGTFDQESAKLAASNGASAPVLAYAQDLVAKANALTPGLQKAIDDNGITPPNRLSTALSARLSHLATLNGSAFDAQYLRDQIYSHEGSLPVFQREAAESKDADMKALAERTVPVVSTDLDRARQLAAPAVPARQRR